MGRYQQTGILPKSNQSEVSVEGFATTLKRWLGIQEESVTLKDIYNWIDEHQVNGHLKSGYQRTEARIGAAYSRFFYRDGKVIDSSRIVAEFENDVREYRNIFKNITPNIKDAKRYIGSLQKVENRSFQSYEDLKKAVLAISHPTPESIAPKLEKINHKFLGNYTEQFVQGDALISSPRSKSLPELSVQISEQDIDKIVKLTDQILMLDMEISDACYSGIDVLDYPWREYADVLFGDAELMEKLNPALNEGDSDFTKVLYNLEDRLTEMSQALFYLLMKSLKYKD